MCFISCTELFHVICSIEIKKITFRLLFILFLFVLHIAFNTDFCCDYDYIIFTLLLLYFVYIYIKKMGSFILLQLLFCHVMFC